MSDFWAGAQRDDPRLKNHPVWKVRNHALFSIPLRVHGDGAEMQNNDSLMAVSFTSLLATGSTRQLNFFTAGWPYSTQAKQKHDHVDTWREIWKVLTWSFNALASGKFPTRDLWASPFPPT
eukprot:8220656-Pyramimonas_sp.AAC.1